MNCIKIYNMHQNGADFICPYQKEKNGKLFFNNRDFESMIELLFALIVLFFPTSCCLKIRFRRQQAPLKPGEDLEVPLNLSLADLYNGVTKRMKVFSEY